jgi:phosphoribosyl-ATP pyrophosphohydrolase
VRAGKQIVSTSEVLDRVYAVIEERGRLRPQGSYVVQLLDGGLERIAAKVREESGELIEAAASGDRRHVAHEAADLLFHVWVLLAQAQVAPAEIYAVLDGRFGIGGLAEKAARGPRC